MIIKRTILIVVVIVVNTVFAQGQNYFEDLCQRAVSAMKINDFVTAKANYDKLISIISKQSGSDLALKIPADVSEYIIVNLSRQNPQEAKNYANTLLDLHIQCLMYCASNGCFSTKGSYLDHVSNACVQVGYILAECGLMKDAEDCITSGITVYSLSEIFTENYPLAYERLAYYYSEYCNDYASALSSVFEGFKAAVSLYGIDSEQSRQVFGRTCINYAYDFAFLADDGYSDKRFEDYNLPIIQYEKLIQISDLWDSFRSEIIEQFGEKTYLSLLSVEPIDIDGDDNITFGTKEWDLLYLSLAAIHYGNINDYEKYCHNLLDVIQDYDDILSYSNTVVTSLRNHNYVNLAFKLYDELLLKVADRKDLVEVVESYAASMAFAYGFFDKAWEYVKELAVNPYTADYNSAQAHIVKLGLLASLYGARGDYQKNMDVLRYAVEKANADPLCISKDIRKVFYNNLSVAYRDINENRESLWALKKAIDLGKSIAEDYGEDPDNPESPLWPAVEYGNLAAYYLLDKGDFLYAEKVLKECLSHYQLNDPYSTNLTYIYDGLIYAAEKQSDYAEMRKWADASYQQSLKTYLERSFGMTKVQRTDYWRLVDNGSFEIFSQLALENGAFSDLAYNSALIQKGFLMHYDAAISNDIKNSGDQELINAYDDFKKAESSGASSKYFLEDRMMYLYSKHPKFIRDVSFVTWRDVQSRLAKRDMAIEFAKCCSDGQNVSYAAILLRQGWESPVIVRLSSEREIVNLFEKGSRAYLDNDRFYSLIWGQIEPYLKGVRRIFFSPYGVISQMNIEVLKNQKGKAINETYDIYRLSTTADLYKDSATDYVSAILFGGLNYNLDTASMRSQSHSYSGMVRYTGQIIAPDNEMTRKGWSYLPGTRKEVEQIKGILDKESIQNTMIVSDAGTEESFKVLSGRSPQILHVATHGFYLNQKQAERIKPSLLNSRDNDNHTYPLRRCGLIMSGGQHAWLGEELPDEIDDGILTAEEVAGLDLSGTDLLVLSACQTGLGEIGGDGVYGLQRGFKIAGVETIVMSLWEVNDQATSLMMQTFYRNLMQGKGKRESFKAAQNEVRKSYPDPHYWAAFIMLD